MKSTIFLLLIGAACVLSAPSETEPSSDDAFATVEVEESSHVVEDPDLYGTCPADGNVTSTFFTCGDHNCSEMDLLEQILVQMNQFTPCQCCHHQHAPNHHDSQNMLLKVANLLQALSNLLNLCGSPQFCCPHHHQPDFHPHTFGPPPHSFAPYPQVFMPQPQPQPQPFMSQSQPFMPHDDSFDMESHEFDKALDDIVSTLMTQMQEEAAVDVIESEEEKAVVEEVRKELESEKEKAASGEAKESLEGRESPEAKESAEKSGKESSEAKESAENSGADLKPHRKSHKSSKKQKEGKEKKDEETSGPSLMDVLNLSR